MNMIEKMVPTKSIKIDYEALVEMIKETKIVNVTIIENYITELINQTCENDSFDYEESSTNYEVSAFYKMHTLACFFTDESNIFAGNSDSYHNLAVDYARQNMFVEACYILEKGIKERQNKDVTLLADYLLYGKEVSSNREKCREYFKCLEKIPRRLWNWRAFSFSVEYLIEERFFTTTTKEENEIKDKALQIVNEYIKRFGGESNPNHEQIDRAISSKVNVYEAFGISANLPNVLKRCADNYGNVPMTLMRLAEMDYKAGRYGDAASYLDKYSAVFKIQPDKSQGYAYLLRAYCNASKLFSVDGANDKNNNKQSDIKMRTLNSIYTDLETAESLMDNKTHLSSINTLRTILDKQCSDEMIKKEEIWE